MTPNACDAELGADLAEARALAIRRRSTPAVARSVARSPALGSRLGCAVEPADEQHQAGEGDLERALGDGVGDRDAARRCRPPRARRAARPRAGAGSRSRAGARRRRARRGSSDSSEVACASSWPRPSTSVSASTARMPPPTPNRPAVTPAAKPSARMPSDLGHSQQLDRDRDEQQREAARDPARRDPLLQPRPGDDAGHGGDRRSPARSRSGGCRRRAWSAAARRSAIITIAASEVPVASRSLVAQPEHEQRDDHDAAADPEHAPEQARHGADRAELEGPAASVAILGACPSRPPRSRSCCARSRRTRRAPPCCSTSTACSPRSSQHPDDAHMPETTRRPLIEVAKRYGVVACVSGRRASDARRIVSLGSIAYLGSHGSEVLRPGSIEPEMDRELQAWTRRVQDFAHEAFGERAAPAARAPGGQGGDRRAALARRARRGGRRGGDPRGRRARREGGLHDPLGPQGARDPAAGADRQGRRDRLAAARHRPRRRDLRRRRRDRPRRLPRPDRAASRWAASAPRSGSACAPTRARRSSREEADWMVEGTDGVRELLQTLLD